LALEYLAWAAAADGDYRRAARLLGAAGRQFRARGGFPFGGGYLRGHRDCTDLTRASLGDDLFTREFQAGGELTLDDVLAYAVEDECDVVDGAPADVVTPPELPPLTPRESQVAGLVARGLSNKQIAAELVIARRTAESHIENILAKLGFTSRSEIAVWHAVHHEAIEDRPGDSSSGRPPTP
jgi:DNA-binding CsgD family transcriptional regulator